MSKTLDEIRTQIDSIDSHIIDLFKQRISYASDIAQYKHDNQLPVFDRRRENAVINAALTKVPESLKVYVEVLMSLLMEASRSEQHKNSTENNKLVDQIIQSQKSTEALFPHTAFVACQGVEGAYSQIAADRFFRRADISYFDTFEAVFRAVEQGFCEYGVLPIENSTAGSVNKVYDLMMQHNFHIVKTCRLKVDHNLLAKPGTKLEDIHMIYSHDQAIAQCSQFIEGLSNVRVRVCENTAIASKMVADANTNDVAALASRSCEELYGLVSLAKSVQDRQDNYTRFACISRDLLIYPGSDRSSLMLIVDNNPGALFKVLAKFYSLDINIIKLESRPIEGHDFEFMFYFDVECPVASDEFMRLIATLGNVCKELRYLGSYQEVL